MSPLRNSSEIPYTDSSLEIFDRKSLNEIGISQQEAERLSQVIIGDEDVTIYQQRQNIDVDGKIGRETYLEMLAGTTLQQAQKGIEKYGIAENTQNKIIFILQNANHKGINTHTLLHFLVNFQKENKNNQKYASFFQTVQQLASSHFKSAQGKANIRTANLNSKTLYKKFKDGDYEWIVTDPTLLVSISTLFLFGVFWASEKVHMDSWIKRLGWLVGWYLLGGHIGIPEMIKDMKDSTENGAFNKGYSEYAPKSNIENIKQKLRGKEYDIAKVFKNTADFTKKYNILTNTLMDKEKNIESLPKLIWLLKEDSIINMSLTEKNINDISWSEKTDKYHVSTDEIKEFLLTMKEIVKEHWTIINYFSRS